LDGLGQQTLEYQSYTYFCFLVHPTPNFLLRSWQFHSITIGSHKKCIIKVKPVFGDEFECRVCSIHLRDVTLPSLEVMTSFLNTQPSRADCSGRSVFVKPCNLVEVENHIAAGLWITGIPAIFAVLTKNNRVVGYVLPDIQNEDDDLWSEHGVLPAFETDDSIFQQRRIHSLPIATFAAQCTESDATALIGHAAHQLLLLLSRGFLHSDLTAGNIFVSKRGLVLIDFETFVSNSLPPEALKNELCLFQECLGLFAKRLQRLPPNFLRKDVLNQPPNTLPEFCRKYLIALRLWAQGRLGPFLPEIRVVSYLSAGEFESVLMIP
jgi:hypothetical protein